MNALRFGLFAPVAFDCDRRHVGIRDGERLRGDDEPGSAVTWYSGAMRSGLDETGCPC